VQKSGDQVRVNVQLINAQTDAHLWAEVYDRKLTDTFAVESEVAQKIAESLQAKLSGAEQKELAARPTNNPEAYDAYLRGKAAWDKLSFSPEDAEAAIGFFQRATQLDPHFAQAWAFLSVAHLQLYGGFDRTPQRLAEAKNAVDKAFAEAPDAGDAWFALALYRYRGLSDYGGALEAFDRALMRGVQRAKALDFSSYVKRRQGKWDDALALQAEAELLDPRNTNLLSEHAETFRSLRRFADAHRTLDRALDVTPRYPNLLAQKAEVYLAQGDLDNARKLLELVPVDARDPSVLGPKIQYLVYAGRNAEAIEALDTVLRTPEAIRDVLRESYRSWVGLLRLVSGDTEGREAAG
jgi:tetratricopeptide (TPR) repeat protein